MEHKSNSYKVKRHQREKVLRFSIRKYSFGAASVAVAALMFLGTRVVSANSVSESGSPSTAGVVSPKNEAESPLGITEPTENKVDVANNSLENKETAIVANSATTVDKAKLKKVVEEVNSLLSTKLNLDNSVVSPIKDRLQKGKEALESSELVQKDIDELVELLSKDVTVLSAASKESSEVQVDKTENQGAIVASAVSSEVRASEENQTVSAKKDSLKVSVDQLKAAVLELPEHETSKEVLEKANELLGLAQGVLQNTTVSLTDVEQMNKLVKRMFNSVKNATTRLTSGSHDPRNGQSMDRGSNLRSVPIDKDKKRGQLGIIVADSGFITGYATPSSTIEIKKNGQTLVTSTLDDSGQFKLNAPGIKVGDTVTLVVNGTTVATEVVSQGHTVSFNDSLAYIKQVDGYTAAESDVEITVGGQKYKTKSQSNGYFTVDVDPNLMVEGAEVTAVVTKDGKVVGRGTSIVRATKVTDFGVGWTENPMIDYSHRDVFSPDTKQYAFVSKGKANQAYNNIRVYREMRIEENGSKYYYWIVDSGPAANAQAGLSKKISLAIPRTVGDPYDFTYTQIKKGKQESYKTYPTASAWEYDHPVFRAYVKDGEKRSGSSYAENADAWMDYIEPSNGWQKNIYRKKSGDGTEPNEDAFPRVLDMLGIKKGGLEYNLVRGVIEDRLNVTAGNRTIMTFKTKVLEGDELDQSIMSDWGKKDKSNPMLSEIKARLANDPYLAYGGYTTGGKVRYKEGQNAIIGTLPLEPREATNFNLQPVSKEQTTKVGVVPDAIKSIGNTDKLPKGTTYRWFKDPDVSKVTEPGKPVYGTVEVVIPQRGKFLVDAAVYVIDDKPQTPVATAKDNGDVTAKPQDSTKVDKITVSYIGEDNQPKTAVGKKDPKGNWTVDTPEVQINPNTGEITIPENKVKDGTEVTVITKNGNGADSDPAKATAKFSKPAKPVAVAKDNGDVTGKPQDPAKVDKITVSYTGEDNKQKTAEGKKDPKGNWTVNTPEVQINPNTGEITIPENKVKDGTEVTVVTKNGNGADSDPATAIAKDVQKPTLTITPSSQTVVEGETVSFTVTAKDNKFVNLDFNDFANKYLSRVLQQKASYSYTTNTNEEKVIKITITTTAEDVGKTNTITFKASDNDGNNADPVNFNFTVTAVNLDKDIYTPKYDDGNGKPGSSVDLPLKEANGKKIPDGTTYVSDQPGVIAVDDKGKVTVTIPADKNPGDKITGKITVTYPDGSKEDVPVNVTVTNRDKDDYTPKYEDGSGKPGTSVDLPLKEANGKKIPDGTTYVSDQPGVIAVDDKGKVTVTIPADKNPGDKITGKITVTYPDGSKEDVPVNVTVTNRDKDDYTPKYEDGSGKPGTSVDLPLKEANGKKIPDGTTYVSDQPGVIDVDDKGKVTVTIPKDKNPGDKITGKITVTYPDGSTEEVPVNVTVTPATPETEKPGKIEITRKPNGDAVVTPKKPDGSTYPSGSKVVIPGENNTPIEVTIGDNGSGEVPNDKLPKKDVPGTGTVTEPNKKPSQPVDVTTPAKATPATPETEKPGKIEITRKPNGDAVVTPKKPDGSTYPSGSKVVIPGENNTPIEVTIGDNGSGEVPNDKLPKKDVPGTGTVTEPNKKPSQPVDVTTPAKATPATPETEKPGKIEITRKPNGDAVVTPKKPDGSTYPSGSKVVIPGENNTPIEVTIGDNGSGEVPNDKLPKKDVPGTGTVTEPNKKPSQPVDVTTPAKATPATPETEKPGKIEITRKPNGDAVVTPKKPDGSTYPSGSKVVIPGENNTPIEVTIGDNGSGEVPNDKLPKKDVPGTGTVTEPNKKPSQPVDVTTPAKATPATPETEKPGKIEITRKPNGDAVVTPKKPDGSTYPSGSKVVIPGENNTPIEVTIGDNGSGEVPNDKLPKKDVPGTGTVTEPNKKPSQPVDVTTPAKATPATPETEKPGKIEITRKPNGDAVVTPKKPDGSTYPSGSKVVIPGENNTPIEVTIGDNGSGEVPNDKLPKKDVPGTGTVTEPNKKPSQPVDVTTPAKATPATPETEKPGKIEITRKPNGDAVVTPKKPDGSTYPSGSKVVIPGENNTPIEVTIGDNGSGEVPNDKLPKKDVPGTGTVTEPNKKPSQPVDVTTPAKATPATPTDTNPVAPVTPDMPVKPDTNGDSGQDKPAPATPTPNAVTPNADQVDTKTTVDNGAKSNDSQNVLPNTGTESNAALASLGLLGLLSGFGLVARKKKED